MNEIIIKEFFKKVEKSYKRMSSLPYSIEKIFQSSDYPWPGDWEGRSLLSFACLYQITGKKISCMDSMIKKLSEHLNQGQYFGKEFNGTILDEQQVAGNSWFLRGLLLYDKNFPQHNVKNIADNLVKNFYLKSFNHFKNYPLQRDNSMKGKVSGEEYLIRDGWCLSTDSGCAFIALDGLSEYYKTSKNAQVKQMLEIMIDKFISIDFLKLKMQTHATLSAVRGIITFYEATNNEKYLEYAKNIFDLYVKHGMTLTYQNFNWFNRQDTWTEPCAIVDSLIVTLKLYKYLNKNKYLKLARRIYFNGMTFSQRENGGAGTDTCVTQKNKFLNIATYEANFCCTMRFTEGLLYVKDSIYLFDWNIQKVIKDKNGRYFCGDILLGEIQNNMKLEKQIVEFNIDAHKLIPVLSLLNISKKIAMTIRQKIVFK